MQVRRNRRLKLNCIGALAILAVWLYPVPSWCWGQDTPPIAPVEPGNRPMPPGRPTSQMTEDRSRGEGPELDGWCPAAYLFAGQALKGDSKLTSTYQGNVYHLSSPQAKAAFDADPEKYLPQYGAWCATSLQGFGNRLTGEPTVFDIVNGKVFLFTSDRARKAFQKDAGDAIHRADQRWSDPELEGWCPVSFTAGSAPVRGSPSHASVFHGFRYFLSSAEAKKAFDANPAKYLPYEIFCATTVGTTNTLAEAQATLFTVVNGRTCFFATPEAKAEFDKDPAAMMAKADANWTTLQRPTRVIRRDRYE